MSDDKLTCKDCTYFHKYEKTCHSIGAFLAGHPPTAMKFRKCVRNPEWIDVDPEEHWCGEWKPR